MRQFSADYLATTRRGLWTERTALTILELPTRTRILDVGCGTGELTAVLGETTDATIVGVDADRALLQEAPANGRVLGDAMDLPFGTDSFDLVVCQALLVNLSDPERAIREFGRVASNTVAAIEPDNGAVTVESTVETESELASRAREAFVDGLDTDVTLGDLSETFERTGLSDVESTRHVHEKRIDPPYTEAAVQGAARKASATRLTEKRETMLAGGITKSAFADLVRDWQEMGRDVIEAMQAETYERIERVPFYVTVGQV